MANETHHEELKLLYEISVKDIEFFKRQQWLITYYCMLAFGALVGLAKFGAAPRWALISSLIVVGLFAMVVLAALEYSIEVRRARLKAVRNQFTTMFNEAWQAKKKEKECYLVDLRALIIMSIHN